mgnify:CR=1 FL=1
MAAAEPTPPARVKAGLIDPKMFLTSIPDAVRKLDPRVMVHSPVMFVVEIGALVPFNQDFESGSTPAEYLTFRQTVKAADAVLFVTPEYNRSIPGVLKNAIDHASRPYGQSAWAGKPAGLLGVSVSPIGSAMAQQHLRNILAYLDVPTLGQPEAFIHAKEGLFDDAGNVGENSRKFLQNWMDQYVAWVKRHVVQASLRT